MHCVATKSCNTVGPVSHPFDNVLQKLETTTIYSSVEKHKIVSGAAMPQSVVLLRMSWRTVSLLQRVAADIRQTIAGAASRHR